MNEQEVRLSVLQEFMQFVGKFPTAIVTTEQALAECDKMVKWVQSGQLPPEKQDD